ncbi:tetratricopeptide repeat protein [Pontiella agarivorans]|uniref:Tetratricopeptide repeat protein n=1 Tax=Pontiella agarivorans TaxID=3038953 RepID=A0ABU5MUX4_9BACT|nr:hypothetical protein [Pontiella agarivorans]MDZ8117970.1 hypothetical protein [Pontiella agarivorans]
MRRLISVVLWLSCSVHAAYVVNNAGRKIPGSEVSATADGRVTLKTPDGQMMVFQKGQYKRAVADRPKELDIAEQLIKTGQGEKAVPFLQQAKKKCRFLQWDQTAIQMLADYYFMTEQYGLAAAAFQALDDQSIPQNRRRLREAMVKSGEMETVLQVFNEDIRNGSREAAAQAYLMRGKLKAERGDPEGARRDWLKVSLFFRTQEAAAEEAEQLLKENEG